MIQVVDQNIRSDNMNNEDLEYIKKFSSITITKACEKAKVDKANLYKGIASKKKIKLVKKILESEVAKLYIIKDE
jgi:hypothetical protein